MPFYRLRCVKPFSRKLIYCTLLDANDEEDARKKLDQEFPIMLMMPELALEFEVINP